MKYITGLFFFFLFSGCFVTGGGYDHGLLVAASESGDGAGQNFRSPKQRFYSGRTCEDDGACVDICEDIFLDDDDDEYKVERCMRTNASLVYKFEDLLETLEDPFSELSLKEIDSKVFGAFLNISLKPWIDDLTDVSHSEARLLLGWIASESGISREIQSVYYFQHESIQPYYKYEGVENLLKEIENLESSLTGEDEKCLRVFNPIREVNISGSRSFWDIIHSTGNQSGKSIACSIIKYHCRNITSADNAETDSRIKAVIESCANIYPSRTDKTKCDAAQVSLPTLIEDLVELNRALSVLEADLKELKEELDKLPDEDKSAHQTNIDDKKTNISAKRTEISNKESEIVNQRESVLAYCSDPWI